MGTETKIEWATHTASPWHGCQHAVGPDGIEHPACANCYAEAMARRKPKTLGEWGPAGTRVVSKSFAANCRRWNKQAEERGVRQSVFPSICDPFEAWDGPIHDSRTGDALLINAAGGRWPEGWPSLIPDADDWGCRYLTMDDLRRDLFATIDACPWLDFLLLTKRPENVRRMWPARGDWWRNFPEHLDKHPDYRSNVWLGTSISDQATADEWIPRLLECRDLCPVLFLSIEPLLGPVDVSVWMPCHRGDASMCFASASPPQQCCECSLNRAGIDWVIVGGESGPNARPCNIEWIRSIRDQCKAAGVPVFVKQFGSRPIVEIRNPTIGAGPAGPLSVYLRDSKGGDWNEWPADLRVREFPEVQHA